MIALLILFSAADLFLLFTGLAVGEGSILWFAPIHLALSCAALLVMMKGLDGLGVRQRFALPIGAAIGPAGMLVCLILAPLVRPSRRKRQIAYRDVRTGKRRDVNDLSPVERLGRILDDRVRYPESDEIGSLATMLRYGNLQARYRALETAVISFEPRLSPLIVMALSDEDQTIRALAAAAAAQVSYNLAQQRSELQARIAPAQHLDDRYALAMLLADHGCFNQLLPQGQRLRLCQDANRKLDEIAGLLKSGDIRRRSLQAARARIRRALERHPAGKARPTRRGDVEPAS
ncbi:MULTISPECIES: hypothetical protein [Sphingobium]|uniref:HEAT repeat domain-containing protein n=1 Tax=Sphingobium fuliginis (strain ATCC 27551) TaxID=336203 RepID=A0ABQ1EVF2_SPHSA|nr:MULTISPECIES: hypothetical protein [Sphingobium]AJR25567.1 hypothetical protein TZ53_19345 [Sphingobium sp. YBL2]RYL98864.1 hypothetical protein EWH10_10275 [Sphingobium fuliginis]UXC92100.1 hypothetical protein EGM87_06400 [Sphingobium sp. RSMS]WDA37674.1 hypothetical protein PO876_05680 [Sphingobium sp. YC-XJ3]GFZ88261.1 hypothetical protein GCM10019071_17380 [Sphingobium fuliginis]